jgi:hypothetical protein
MHVFIIRCSLGVCTCRIKYSQNGKNVDGMGMTGWSTGVVHGQMCMISLCLTISGPDAAGHIYVGVDGADAKPYQRHTGVRIVQTINLV